MLVALANLVEYTEKYNGALYKLYDIIKSLDSRHLTIMKQICHTFFSF